MDHLDAFDRNILSQLQARGDIPVSELAALIHLSPSQCSRRVSRLKEQGYIRETVALLNPARLNLAVEAYVTVTIKDHLPDTEERFRERVEALAEIVSCDYVAGEADYILKVVTEDLASYQRFLSQKLLQGGHISSVRSSIILKPMKRMTALPLDFV